jgi:pimeloyl-ACP methyl ester carboxylesterase
MSKTLLLLHGALGSAKQLDPIKEGLAANYKVYSLNFPGHGGTKIPDKIMMPDLVDQLEQFIKQNISSSDDLTIFGYSMGGYAALMLASKGNCKINNIVTLGTKLFWTPEIAAKEVRMLNPFVIEEKVPVFAKELNDRHEPSDWKLLMQKTADMMIDLGENQYLSDKVLDNISVPVKLMIGDGDKMVSLDETIDVFRKIKTASLAVLPDTPHVMEKVDINRLIFELS